MVDQSELERMIEQVTELYLTAQPGSASETYLEGQLVALKWVIDQMLWTDIGQKVRAMKRPAVQNG